MDFIPFSLLNIGRGGNRFYLSFLSVVSVIIFLSAAFSLQGCGGAGEESDNPDDMITIEGSVSQTVSPLLNADGVPLYSINGAIAAEGDMVFLFLNGASVSSSQIKGGKYKFYGGYKGRKVSLKFGLTKNEVYVGIIDASASGTIVLPIFNEYHVISKKVIEVQAAEGRTKLENFIVSNGRFDLTAVINALKDALAPKFLTSPEIYGTSAADLVEKISNSSIDMVSAFSYKQLSIFAEAPKIITISPSNYSLGVNETGQFTVSMSGFTNRSVIYKVNDMIGGNAQVGVINAAGLFTAPSVINLQSSVTVTSQSVEDPSRESTALVVLTPVSVVINNGNETVTLARLDKDYNFARAVNGHSDKRLRWYVNDIEFGNILTTGYISSDGRYSRPASVPSFKITVKAVSVADPTKYGLCEVILTD